MKQQINALRSMASEVAELAHSGKNRATRQLWMDHNALKSQRPLVYVAIGCWDEIIRADEWVFQQGPFKDVERILRQTLYNARLGFDFVVDPFITVPAVMAGPPASEIFGMPIERRAAPEQKGAWGYNPPLKSYDDLDKLKKPRYAVDEEATRRRADAMREALGNCLEVRVDYGGVPGISAALGQHAAELRGLEQLMTDVVDHPEGVHALMRFLRDAHLEYLQSMEAQGRVTPNHVRWPFYHEPLRADFDRDRVRLQDCWGWAESQEFDLFSPTMFDEFLLQYQLPILSLTSLNNYGCCENLAQKYALLKKIPNLRRVSVSPWSSMEKAIEELGGRCVFNWRYNPTEVIFSFSEKNIRQTLRRHFRMAAGLPVEVVLQDVQTVNGEPEIIRRWAEIAGQEAGVDCRSPGRPRVSFSSRYRAIPEWPHLRKRYLAFWNREVLDNRIIVHIQNPNPRRPAPEPWMLEESPEKYLDPGKFFDLVSWRRTAWNWHADLFKYRVASCGPNVFVGFCGGKPVFGRDTVWHEPVIASLDEADKIHFDENNSWWKMHLEMTARFAERCAGVEQFGMTDFGGPTDWISQLMGAENFLLATIEQPEKMRAFALRLGGECNRAFDLVYPLVACHNDGVVNWMPVWSDRRMGTVQDDMAINFSPSMYADVFAPALQTMAAHSERTVLHWHDGCAHHLDTLLKIEALTLIQFGHDPNTPSFRQSLGHMQKIQAAGKLLFISCVEADDAEFFVSHLDPRGLLMIINTSDDLASQQMQANVEKWTAERLDSMDQDDRRLVP